MYTVVFYQVSYQVDMGTVRTGIHSPHCLVIIVGSGNNKSITESSHIRVIHVRDGSEVKTL